MGEDEVRPGESPPQTGGLHSPVTIEHEAGMHAATSAGEGIATHGARPLDATAEPTQLDEPAMAAADLASPDRPAEEFSPGLGQTGAATPGSAPQRRSMMGTLLAAIGLVLIALLGVNLYFMFDPPANNALAAVQAQQTGLDRRLAALEKRPTAAPLDARVKALEDKVDTLSAAIAKPTEDPGLTSRVAALDKALSDLRQQVASLPKPDFGPVDAKIAAVAGSVAAVSGNLTGMKTDLASLSTAVTGLDHRLAPIEKEFSAPKIAANVTEARQEGSAAETRAAPVAVTAQAMLQAIDDGKGFAPEVAALRSLGIDKAQLAVLEPLAAKGAPTKADLVDGFAAVRDAMVVAAAPVKTGTMFDRMMASAQGLVKVRPAGASPGGDADAIVSRIDADLSAGDFRAALNEWNGLPDASKKPSASWADQLKARVAAEGTARAIAAGAITALGPTQ